MHEKRIEIRWGDLDPYAHVNNAVYLTYLEAARTEWLQRTLGSWEDVQEFVLARVAIEFRSELVVGDGPVVARCRPVRLGRSSITTQEDVHPAGGALAARAEVVIVARDRASGGSRPLSERERAALAAQLPPAE